MYLPVWEDPDLHHGPVWRTSDQCQSSIACQGCILTKRVYWLAGIARCRRNASSRSHVGGGQVRSRLCQRDRSFSKRVPLRPSGNARCSYIIRQLAHASESRNKPTMAVQACISRMSTFSPETRMLMPDSTFSRSLALNALGP